MVSQTILIALPVLLVILVIVCLSHSQPWKSLESIAAVIAFLVVFVLVLKSHLPISKIPVPRIPM